jgi:hypothetical protein
MAGMSAKRTRIDEIGVLLEQTADANPKVRALPVQTLCPCHTRRNESRVWDRVLELVEDPALDVRRCVFHLLGGGSRRDREQQMVALRRARRQAAIKLTRMSQPRNDSSQASLGGAPR